jgi:serine/threonine protein phosphatase 1
VADRDKFAILHGAERIWAVAAIHGEAERLVQLHRQLAPVLEPKDRLVYLGNYLGHGPAVGPTLDELLRFRRWFLARGWNRVCELAYLRGAQEEMWAKLLQLQFAVDPRQVLGWMLDHGIEATLKAYGGSGQRGMAAAREGAVQITRWTNQLRAEVKAAPGHDPFLAGLRRAAYSEDGRLLFVHAGVDVSRPLAAQSDSLWWGGGRFGEIAQPYGEFVMIVRGFDQQHGGVVAGPYTTTLDAGSGFGGRLVAGCFDPAGKLLGTIEA